MVHLTRFQTGEAFFLEEFPAHGCHSETRAFAPLVEEGFLQFKYERIGVIEGYGIRFHASSL
jgi:hypothetical protein